MSGGACLPPPKPLCPLRLHLMQCQTMHQPQAITNADLPTHPPTHPHLPAGAISVVSEGVRTYRNGTDGACMLTGLPCLLAHLWLVYLLP